MSAASGTPSMVSQSGAEVAVPSCKSSRPLRSPHAIRTPPSNTLSPHKYADATPHEYWAAVRGSGYLCGESVFDGGVRIACGERSGRLLLQLGTATSAPDWDTMLGVPDAADMASDHCESFSVAE